MNTTPLESPVEEQEICVNCGLCCDGTLFSYAILQAGERGTLPEKIEEKYGKDEENEFFTLPCAYFCGKCTIYGQKRAIVCSTFRCNLLKKFSKGEINQGEAFKAVDTSIELRAEIFQMYKIICGTEFTRSFRELLRELPEILKIYEGDFLKKKEIKLLILKCGLYDIMLTKAFKPAAEFQSLLKDSM